MPMQLSLTSLPVIGSQDGMLLFLADKYLITMAWIIWESWKKAPGTLTSFFDSVRLCYKNTSQTPDTLLLEVCGSFCLESFLEISVKHLCF